MAVGQSLSTINEASVAAGISYHEKLFFELGHYMEVILATLRSEELHGIILVERQIVLKKGRESRC